VGPAGAAADTAASVIGELPRGGVACVPAGTLPTTPDDGGSAEERPPPSGDVTEGGRYIPVGFSICDLAVPPQPAAAAGHAAPTSTTAAAATSTPAPLLLAACGDNGVVYVYPFGCNRVAARLVGHVAANALGAQTRITWVPPRRAPTPPVPLPSAHLPSAAAAAAAAGALPPPLPLPPTTTSECFYLAASSERDFSVVVYSVGAGRPVARLGIGQPVPGGWLDASRGSSDDEGERGGPGRACYQPRGHTASIKDLAVVVAPPAVGGGDDGAWPLLLTVGFDKRLLVWR
jgi:hypothetical protein